MRKIKFDKALENKCAKHIRDNFGKSITWLFQKSPERPIGMGAIKGHYYSSSEFLRNIGVRLCELNHIGSKQRIEMDELFYSHRDGILRIVKEEEDNHQKLYKLTNGQTYSQGLLVEYLDLNKAYPDKKIDIQQFEKVHQMINGASRRSKKRNIPFQLSVLSLYELYNFRLPRRCEVLKKTKLDYYNRIPGKMQESPSLDRIKPRLGYVKGNVRIISHRANAYCSDMEIKDCLQVLKYKIGSGKDILIVNKQKIV